MVVEPFIRMCGRGFTFTMPPLDDLGHVLVNLDNDRIPAEAVLAGLGKSSKAEKFRTFDHTLYLQNRGLMPKTIPNLPLYVLHNQARGTSDATILTTLLIRGGTELLNERNALKAKPTATEANQAATSKTDGSLKECESCQNYETLLTEEKNRNSILKLENRFLEAKERSLEKRLREHMLYNMALAAAMINQLDKFVEETSRIVKTSSLDGIGISCFARFTLKNILNYNHISLLQLG